MSPTYEVSIEALPQISEETMSLLRDSAPSCADCALILKHVVGSDRLAPVWRPDGTEMKLDQVKQHILELKGLALSTLTIKFLRERAGTCRKPNGVGCIYCARILDSLSKEGRLRDWPHDTKDEQLTIPVDSQVTHIMLETGKPVIWEEARA